MIQCEDGRRTIYITEKAHWPLQEGDEDMYPPPDETDSELEEL